MDSKYQNVDSDDSNNTNTKALMEWSYHEVAAWIKTVEDGAFAEYAESIINNEINGQTLCSYTREHLELNVDINKISDSQTFYLLYQSIQKLKEKNSSVEDKTQDIHQNSSHKERKDRSKILVAGYIRELELTKMISVIPSEITNLFHKYYFELFEAKWCDKNKGYNMHLSENNTKITLVNSFHESCRGRDPICKGMVVEWYCNCYVIDGIGLGVVSSKNKEWNTSSNRALIDAYGIDDCKNRVYFGNKRHIYIEYDSELYDANDPWVKPNIKHNDSSQTIKLVCDYKTNVEFATLTYYFDGKVCKPSKKNYTFKLPKLENNECWYMCVDFWNCDSWCKVSDDDGRTQVLSTKISNTKLIED